MSTAQDVTELLKARRATALAVHDVVNHIVLLAIFGARYILGAIFAWPVEATDLMWITLGALTYEAAVAYLCARRAAKLRGKIT